LRVKDKRRPGEDLLELVREGIDRFLYPEFQPFRID
jgi:hypothetical protein